jgi:hypothetical protein
VAIIIARIGQLILKNKEKLDKVKKLPKPKKRPKKPKEKPKEKPKPKRRKKIPEGDIFKHPKGVPKDWVKKPTKKGDGVQCVDPKNSGTYVRIKKGDLNSSNSGQRYDNVRWQKNGRSFDKNGKEVPQQSQESHIPVEEFEFNPELFR